MKTVSRSLGHRQCQAESVHSWNGALFGNPSEVALNCERYSILEPSDILISRAGTVGRMCVAMPAVEQVDSTSRSNLIRLTLNPGAMLPAYFAFGLYTFCGKRLPSLESIWS